MDSESPDDFARLEVSRRPWLDPEDLKARFVRLSFDAHPDRMTGVSGTEARSANAAFASLTGAYNCLRDLRERLRLLLTLEQGSAPPEVQPIPPGTMDLFIEVGSVTREVDAFLAGTDPENSPMLRVRRFEEGLNWTDRLQALQGRLTARRLGIEAELQSMNVIWDNAPPAGSPDRLEALPLERLGQLHRIGSYVLRWESQIQERLARLSLL